ncbi:TPA: hypothetical protein RPE44_000621 [Salmonella enterica]|nr:hypothetical protein [Salmonella enterica]
MLKVFDDLSRRGGLFGGLFKKMSADMRNQLAQQQPQQPPIAQLSSRALQVPDTTAQGQPQPQPGNSATTTISQHAGFAGCDAAQKAIFTTGIFTKPVSHPVGFSRFTLRQIGTWSMRGVNAFR